MENNANQLNPMLCKRNCGFFGNAAYDGYCSKCYKEHVKRQNSGSAAGRVTPTSSSNSSATQPTIPSSDVVMAATTSSGTGEQQATTSITIDTSSRSSAPSPAPIAAPSHHSTAPIAIPVLLQTANNNTSTVQSMDDSLSSTPVAATAPTVVDPTAAVAAAVSAATMSMSCSDTMMSTQVQTPSSTSLLSTSATSSGSSPAPGTSVDSVTGEKKKRSRCSLESCKRKVGLTGFDCRCGGLFCWEHRYSDKHDCQFDYKELGQDQIRKNNPIVVGEKIQKI